MRPRGFIEDWRPRQRSLDLLAKVEAIIAEYAMPLTIRQIFYRLVGRYGYDKTEQAYDNLREPLTKARRAQRSLTGFVGILVHGNCVAGDFPGAHPFPSRSPEPF
jgi:hypothetical protein